METRNFHVQPTCNCGDPVKPIVPKIHPLRKAYRMTMVMVLCSPRTTHKRCLISETLTGLELSTRGATCLLMLRTTFRLAPHTSKNIPPRLQRTPSRHPLPLTAHGKPPSRIPYHVDLRLHFCLIQPVPLRLPTTMQPHLTIPTKSALLIHRHRLNWPRIPTTLSLFGTHRTARQLPPTGSTEEVDDELPVTTYIRIACTFGDSDRSRIRRRRPCPRKAHQKCPPPRPHSVSATISRNCSRPRRRPPI
jgi:hypothetical protein